MADMRTQAIMGIIPPDVAEARLRYRWPSVARYGAPAKLGNSIIQAARGLVLGVIKMPFILAAILVLPATILAFLIALSAYLLLAPFFFAKVMPITMTRYMITNRRVMIQKGWSLKPDGEVPLEKIEAVRVVPGSEQAFFNSADLELVSDGRVALTLRGVPEAEHFKINIENAYLAWGRKNPPKEQILPASAMGKN
jgi:uncharacterized membrane protein YdbT with pleckstrin-like domain